METLADELVLHIFRFCGAREVAALEATCLRLASDKPVVGCNLPLFSDTNGQLRLRS